MNHIACWEVIRVFHWSKLEVRNYLVFRKWSASVFHNFISYAVWITFLALLRSLHTESAHFIWKNKYDLMLCQSRLHTASETFVRQKKFGSGSIFCVFASVACILIGMNEWWMMHLYSAFIVYCHTPKALYNHVGGLFSTTTSVQHHLDDATAATGQRRQCRSPHTSYRWRGERVIEPIKWMGIIRRPW